MFEVIYSHSRTQALQDGVLIDVSKMAKEAGFKYPVAITSGIEGIIQRAIANPKYCNDYNGVLWDILWMCSMKVRSLTTYKDKISDFPFQVIITGVGQRKYYTFKAACNPGDDMEPAITIMLPNED